MKNGIKTATAIALVMAAASGAAMAEPQVPMSAVADMVHAVLDADRTAYTKYIVNRLRDERGLAASPHWKDEKTLPLPTQMLSLGEDIAQVAYPGMSYSLISFWPVNKNDAPQTAAEQEGLKQVSDAGTGPYYTYETLGGKHYYTAVYPDVATAPACVSCHNSLLGHKRRDFKLGDVMGAMVLRLPIK